MLIGLSTGVFDLDGAVMADARTDSDFDTLSRRVSRSATLDGGAIITDGGYTAGDDGANLLFPYTDALFDSLSTMIKNHTSVNLATPTGFYWGVLERVSRQRDGDIEVDYLAVSGV